MLVCFSPIDLYLYTAITMSIGGGGPSIFGPDHLLGLTVMRVGHMVWYGKTVAVCSMASIP